MIYLLDTNTCIRFLRDAASPVRQRMAQIPYHDIALCAIVKAELYYGAQRSANPEHAQRMLAEFAAHFGSLPFDDRGAIVYGEIRADLTQRGLIIGPNDLFIAATALVHQATLVTHNTREFGRVPGLCLEDWEV